MIVRLIALLLLLCTPLLLAAGPGLAAADDPDPADFLPGGSRIVSTVQGDADGDGQLDLVVLYTLPTSGGAPARAGLLVLVGAPDGPRPAHLFGAPPHNLHGEPVVDPRGTTDLSLHDLTGDGQSEIVLRVTNRFQEPTDRHLVWIFERDRAPVPPPASVDDLPPPWTGSGFRLAAFLEGSTVEVGPVTAGASAILRRDVQQHELSGPDPYVRVAETFHWRRDGFRLVERSLTQPAGAIPARSPETAVLAFYAAVGRGDLAAATDLLGDDLRASRSSSLQLDPTAPARALRVEELRLLDSRQHDRETPPAEQRVYVRASLADPAPEQPDRRHSFAGVWTVRQDGERWKLVAASLHQTIGLAAIADGLPGGTSILQTSGGDVRGRGVEDIAVLAMRPGRYATVEPWILFGTVSGLEPALPLSSFVADPFLGGMAGTIGIEDVTGDGTREITFGASVGAHGSMLWVLGWNGSTLVPLFEGGSNTPVVALEHLDEDAVPEVLMLQNGYCGGYASSPVLGFVFRWDNGTYRSASWRYPAIYDGVDDHVASLMDAGASDRRLNPALACAQHLFATANVLRGRPAEARTAYQTYVALREQSPAEERAFVYPSYLGEPYVEADLRAVGAAIDAGQRPGWGPRERAILHDLLGDCLVRRARLHEYEAERADGRGSAVDAAAARQQASEARAAAAHEYRAALALDPEDAEARRALGE